MKMNGRPNKMSKSHFNRPTTFQTFNTYTDTQNKKQTNEQKRHHPVTDT